MSDQSGAGATPSPDSTTGTGATPIQSSEGVVLVAPSTPSRAGETPTETTPPADSGRRDADAEAEREEARRDASASPDDLRRALDASRKAERQAARELKRLQDAEKAREDANKTELQRATERADAAEAKASALERQIAAQAIAAEFGVPQWADELRGDADTRSMRAHAQRIRERLGLSGTPGPGMDGGVRSLGAPPQPQSMDDLIRGGVRR